MGNGVSRPHSNLNQLLPPTTATMVTLTDDQINQLSLTSFLLQFLTEPTSNDLTGVELASTLLSHLQSNGSSAEYSGRKVVDIVGAASFNSSIDATGAEQILTMLSRNMPHERRFFYAGLWIMFTIVSGCMILLRFYTRQFLGGGLKKDDAMLAVAWVLASYYSLNDANTFYHHNGELSSWDVRGIDIKEHWKSEAIGLLLFFAASALYKTSLILFYKELSPSKIYKYCSWTLLGIVWIYTVLAEIWVVLDCQPFDTWNHPLISVCMPYHQAYAYMTSLWVGDMVMDLAVLCLPLSIIYGLQLRSKEKMLVYCLICLGCLVCICAAARIQLVGPYLKSNDMTRNTLNMCTWTLLEVHLGITCASAPMLRRCFLHVFPLLKSTASRLYPSSSSRTGSTSHGGGEVRELNLKKKKIRTIAIFPTTLRGGTLMTEATAVADSLHVDDKPQDEKKGGMLSTVLSNTSTRIGTPTQESREAAMMRQPPRPFTPVDEEKGNLTPERLSRIENGRVVDISDSSRNSQSSLPPQTRGSISRQNSEAQVRQNVSRQNSSNGPERKVVDIPPDNDEEPVRYHYSFESMRVVKAPGQEGRGHSRSNSRSSVGGGGGGGGGGGHSRSNSRSGMAGIAKMGP